MRVDVAGCSDTGKVRSNNQDRFAIRRDLPDGAILCVVADGMGGYASGDLAATLAVEQVVEAVLAGAAMPAAAAAANSLIYQRSATEPAHRGMGTTLTAVRLTSVNAAGSGQAELVHVGDSRLYLIRGGSARQLSADHSWVAEEVRAGRLTAEDARHSKRRNLITRALGLEPVVEVDAATYSLHPGDALLLCSDGVHTLVDDDELAAACGEPADEGSRHLVDLVVRRGAPDNATVVIARWLDEGGDQGRGVITRPLPVLAPDVAGDGPVAATAASPAPTEARLPPARAIPRFAAKRPGLPRAAHPAVRDRRPPASVVARPGWLLVALYLIPAILALVAVAYLVFHGQAL